MIHIQTTLEKFNAALAMFLANGGTVTKNEENSGFAVLPVFLVAEIRMSYSFKDGKASFGIIDRPIWVGSDDIEHRLRAVLE